MITHNAASLIKAGRQINEPFQLAVSREGEDELSMTVVKILRLLPGKRIVAVAKVAGQPLLVKIFVGRFAKRYEKREIFGVQAIERAGVLTPRLEWHAKLTCGKGYVLAFEYIADAHNLIDVWERADTDVERAELIRKVMPVLAQLHQGGVVQNDIHPENFLFANDRIYTIDGGDVTHKDAKTLSETHSVENLALFFAQFTANSDHQMEALFADYCAQRDWSVDDARLIALRENILIHRESRKRDYISKAFRDCTRFYCERSLTRFLVCERRYDSTAMRGFLEDLDLAMAEGRCLKSGNTATVALIDAPVGPLVVKRYNIKHAWHGLSRLFRPSRAWTSWENTMRLEFLGISTVRPVALIEERWGPFRRRAYFVTEYIDGPDASVLASQENPDVAASSIAKILKSLSEARVTHGDLKASNFLLSENGPVIIDLDSMREHTDPMILQRAERKDHERFMRNWSSSPQMERHFSDLLD